jgi:hypothetical protein
MNQNNIPFQLTNWELVPKVEHKGDTGVAYWQTLQFGDLRVRMVEYSKNYLADHWCQKGHIIFCIEGAMTTELADGKEYILTKGMSYQVSDDLSSHRTYSKDGVKLFIVDGTFLKLQESK